MLISENLWQDLPNEVAAAVFAPWPNVVSRGRRRAQEADEPATIDEGWDRFAYIVTCLAQGSRSMSANIRVDGGWTRPDVELPQVVDDVIDEAHAGIDAENFPAAIIVCADRTTGTARRTVVTGPAVWRWSVGMRGELDAYLADLFGEVVAQPDSEWEPLSVEHVVRPGVLARLRASALTAEGIEVTVPSSVTPWGDNRYLILDDGPGVAGDIRIWPEGASNDVQPVRVRVECLEAQDVYPPSRSTGKSTQDLVGGWRLQTVEALELDWSEDLAEDANDRWLDGQPDLAGAVRSSTAPIEAPFAVELTIRPDGSFYELADDTDDEIPFWSGEAALEGLGYTFNGFLGTQDGRDYVLDYEELGYPPTVRRCDDIEIVEELVREGTTLNRIQNVIVDGIYRYRVILRYLLAS
ncbi:hypothetical protein EF294_00545 [Gordonia oryzae]|uniref:Uncharacterized protein n=1 Tax=Gordonia oryzae TaxID=2487349 RepID=A0A3N4GUV8_9ACTN|nr:hypothetical protein [Gordonia oryzae]RPA66115.1 hypothetical protein EF294_00545 [Gordonia oryzae]